MVGANVLLKSMPPQKKVPLQAWSRGTEKSASRNHSRASRVEPAQVTEDIGFCPVTNRSSLTACRLKVFNLDTLGTEFLELDLQNVKHFSVHTNGFLLIVAESSDLLSPHEGPCAIFLRQRSQWCRCTRRLQPFRRVRPRDDVSTSLLKSHKDTVTASEEDAVDVLDHHLDLHLVQRLRVLGGYDVI